MKKELFSTPNTGLVGALVSCGYKMIESKKIDNEVFFYFEKDDNIEDDARRYHTGSLKVDALTFFIEVKKLRRIIGAHYRIAEETEYLKKEEVEKVVEKSNKKDKDGFYKV
jgi:hypothetical protein